MAPVLPSLSFGLSHCQMGLEGCPGGPSLPHLWLVCEPRVLIPDSPSDPCWHPRGISPQQAGPEAELMGGDHWAPSSHCSLAQAGSAKDRLGGWGVGRAQSPWGWRGAEVGAGRVLCAPGKPPIPPPLALLGKADGRKNPVGHPSGRQSGPVQGGEPGNLIIKKPSWLSGGI